MPKNNKSNKKNKSAQKKAQGNVTENQVQTGQPQQNLEPVNVTKVKQDDTPIPQKRVEEESKEEQPKDASKPVLK